MEFDSNHKVKLETLNFIEKEEYEAFLRKEKVRHQETYNRCKARAEFWESEATRQAEELDKLDVRMAKVKEMFGL